MATTYTWEIESLNCIPLIEGKTKVISCVHWRVNATDGVNNATVYGAQSLTFDAKNAFTNYEDITKDTVVVWVQAAMGIDAVTSIQQTLDKQLNALANPPIITPPLPWSN